MSNSKESNESVASATAGSIINPSKGVDYYAYLDRKFPAVVTFSQPTNGGHSTQTYPISTPGMIQRHGT